MPRAQNPRHVVDRRATRSHETNAPGAGPGAKAVEVLSYVSGSYFSRLLVADVGNREQLALANGFNGTGSYGVRRRSIDLARLHSKDARVLNCVSSNSDAVRRREYEDPERPEEHAAAQTIRRKLRRGDSPG